MRLFQFPQTAVICRSLATQQTVEIGCSLDQVVSCPISLIHQVRQEGVFCIQEVGVFCIHVVQKSNSGQNQSLQPQAVSFQYSPLALSPSYSPH